MAADEQGFDTGERRSNNATIGLFAGALTLVVLLLVGAVIVGVANAPSDAERAARAQARSENLTAADAARLWSTHCAACHGPRGKGLTAPDSRNVSERLTVAEHVDIVREGVTSMPAFGGVLLEAEIDAIVAHQRNVLDNP